jgi:hypothetical protein
MANDRSRSVTRELVCSTWLYQRATGCKAVTPRRLFRFLGIRPSDVEAVRVELDRIVVDLYQPVTA